MAAWTRSSFCCPSIQKIRDKLERAAIASDLAGYLGVEPGLVLDQFKRAARRTAALPGPAAAAAVRRFRPSNGCWCRRCCRAKRLARRFFRSFRRMTDGILQPAKSVDGAAASDRIGRSPVTFSALEGRLDAPAQDLLHEIVAADEMSDELHALEQAGPACASSGSGSEEDASWTTFAGPRESGRAGGRGWKKRCD